MFRRTLVLAFALLAWQASAQPAARKPETYLPKNALSCERAVTLGDADKYCRSCNQEATVGAARRITLQVGGCARRRLEEAAEVTESAATYGSESRELRSETLRVAEFTNTGIQFFKPLTATGLTTTGPNTLNGLTTIANLVTNAPIAYPGFVVPKGSAGITNVAPKLAMSFGTAGLYFYYSPDLGGGSPISPGSATFGAAAVPCSSTTHGSVVVNTASFGPQAPSFWICGYTTVGDTYSWQPVFSG